MAQARLILRRKWTDERGNLYEMAIWRVDRSSLYPEAVRYRLAFIRAGEARPALLYDNHHPKGHHRHVGTAEEPYPFRRRDSSSRIFSFKRASWQET